MLNQIFNSQTKTITFAAILLSISALASRILGLLRDRLLAGTFGAGPELDIYFAAFRIPDFVYGVLITGGVTAAFLPVFSEHRKKNLLEGWKLANNVLNCFLILLVLICGILAIFTPFLIKFIVPGFEPNQKSLTISLTRIMFLSPIFFGLSSVFSGILQYFNRFLVYSLAPILYNLGIIFGILFLFPIFGLFGLAYGVVLGALFHWLIQIPAAKNAGYFYQPLFNLKYRGLIKIFKLMLPRAIGQAAYQFNLIFLVAIASGLTVGSIAIFNFSQNLYYFPIGLIGISFAMASFPRLSQAWADGNKEKFLEDFSLTLRQILFLIIPVSISMFLLRAQIVRLILGTGQFGWWETRLTAACLGLFSLGIFAKSIVPFLNKTFFSLQDTKTPVKIGIFSIILNIFLALLFVCQLSFKNPFREIICSFLKLKGIEDIRIIALPLAFSLSGVSEFFLLLTLLSKRIFEIKLREIWQSFTKILIGTFFMAVFVYLTLQLVAGFVNMQTFLGVLIQTSLACLIGIFVYFLVTFLLKSPEIKIIWSSILKQFKKD